MQVYGDHVELMDGTLVPGPGGCHPALESCRDVVLRHGGKRWEAVRVPVFSELTASTMAEPEFVKPAELVFHPVTVTAMDDIGQRWTWTVWMDQYKRGIASGAEIRDP